MVLTLRRRIVNSTLIVMLLHLIVVSGGSACGLATGGGAMAGMSGMASTPGMQMTPDQAPHPAGQGKCGNPMPGSPAGCQSMAECVPTAVKVDPIIIVAPAEHADVVSAAYAPMFSSVTPTPEPRPPRA